MLWFGLVYWVVTPQQQPGSYQGGEMMMMMMMMLMMMMMKSVFLVEETGVPGGNHQPTASIVGRICDNLGPSRAVESFQISSF